ncbi:MAG TPA: hypothetical protein VMM17_11035 [Gemmatimonadaceae bacterium]|nr:hypothetical protein [Gemmatimonadaceae bacterium]
MRSTKFSNLPRALALALLLFVARPGLAIEPLEAAAGARPEPTLATGHVFIMLQTDPDESPTGFSFTHTFGVSSPVPSPFTLTDGSLQIFNNVPIGPYTVTQLATSGWALVESAAGYETGCSNSSGTIDIGSGVATINVAAGGFVVCTFVMQEIVEVPPDPDSPSWTPRGIGYWKNSGKCLKNQSQVARVNDEHQVRMLESQLLGGSAVYPLGSITGMTCLEAARILDKSDLAGAKKANDGAYNLAAHLLAAKLNKAAGAFVPPCAANDMATAQSLLVQLGFTGIGDYLGPATSMQSLRTTALRLGGTLASFNDATLKDGACP